MEEKLRYLSQIDILTGLYNRYSFEEKIKELNYEDIIDGSKSELIIFITLIVYSTIDLQAHKFRKDGVLRDIIANQI